MTLSRSQPVRIAMFGLPGAGKSTTAALLRRSLDERDARPAVVRIGSPLYDVQRAFYARAGVPLADGQQDGALLNFLGSHFRSAVPGFLLEDFRKRCDLAILGGSDVLICDDARPADLDELSEQGFALVRMSAPDELRRARKSARGDRVNGDDNHPTETGGFAGTPDYEIVNDGDMTQLRTRVDALLATLGEHQFQAAAPRSDLQDDLQALARRAEMAITPRYAENRHQIGAVIIAGDGQIFTGIHVEAMVGRASVCAEAIALAKACEAGATDLRLVMAVRHPKPSEADKRIRPVPPCGLCRELLLDYGPEMQAVIATPDGLSCVPLAQLLPNKYVGTKWNTRPMAEAAR